MTTSPGDTFLLYLLHCLLPSVHLVLFPQILWVRKGHTMHQAVLLVSQRDCVYLLNVHPRLLIIICISLLVCVCERQNQDGSKHGSKAHLSVCYHHKCCHHHHHHHYSEQSSEARYVIYDCFRDRHLICVMIITPLE